MTGATCDEITLELVAFLDGELSDADRRPVATHLATCLGCRREAERLGTVQRWVASLPPIAPSEGFDAEFWRRMNATEAAVPTLRRRRRVWTLAVPALAAAAMVAIVARSLLSPAAPTTVAGTATAPKHVAQAPAAKQAPAVAANQATRPAPAAQVADAQQPLPEDLPPELVEHPELFLRLPVVRRLEKLEVFEEVKQHTPPEAATQDGAG